MIKRKQLGELTAMVRLAGQIAADGDREYLRSQEKAEQIEQEMERLALANGFTVDEVLFAEQHDEQPEPAAA
jgi:hypothetical protein